MFEWTLTRCDVMPRLIYLWSFMNRPDPMTDAKVINVSFLGASKDSEIPV